MPQPAQAGKVFRFGVFEADVRSGELRKHGLKVKLHGQPFEALILLLENAGRLVTRSEFRERLWPDNTFVDFENCLNTAINEIRKALNDSADTPRFVETVPRRGYRIIIPVEEVASTVKAASPLTQVPIWRRWLRRQYLLIIGVTIVAVLLSVTWGGRRRSRVQAPHIQSVAVLPLENLSSDPEQEYFADGMTEALISRLVQIRSLQVISRTSIMQYKRAKRSLPVIAKELNVDAVLEGTILRSGNRVRVSAQLIHAATDQHIWATTYDRDVRDVLALQSEVAQAIAQEIEVKLTAQEQVRLHNQPTINFEAFDAYLKGRYHTNQFTPAAVKKGLEQFQRATEIDSGYAAAYAGIAQAYLMLGQPLSRGSGLPQRDALAKSAVAAARALELDPNLPEAHAVLGSTRWLHDWDWPGADQELRRAIELDPNSADALTQYAVMLAASGRRGEAKDQINRAMARDPLNLRIQTVAAELTYRTGNYDGALEQSRRVLDLAPDFARAHLVQAWAYQGKGMNREASNAYQRWRTLSGGSPAEATRLQRAFDDGGLKVFYREWAQIMVEESRHTYVRPTLIAGCYAGTGDAEAMFQYLEKAYRERDSQLLFLQIDPLFQRFRSDPRLQNLLRRIGFPE